MKCGYVWLAPKLRPGGKTAWVREVCVLDKDHKTDHESRGKVTTPNIKPKES